MRTLRLNEVKYSVEDCTTDNGGGQFVTTSFAGVKVFAS